MRMRVITGSATDFPFSLVQLRTVRVGGTANLVGAVQIKRGTTVIETIPAAATPGTERDWDDLQFDNDTGQLQINLANAGDTVLVFFT